MSITSLYLFKSCTEDERKRGRGKEKQQQRGKKGTRSTGWWSSGYQTFRIIPNRFTSHRMYTTQIEKKSTMQFLTNLTKSGLRRRWWVPSITNMIGVPISLKLGGHTWNSVPITYTCDFVHVSTAHIWTLHISQTKRPIALKVGPFFLHRCGVQDRSIKQR